ncbi:MAG: radical SAM family heme chaperone HemW [bacterium]
MPLGLYLHVPYCRRVCPYCDFFVLPIGRRHGPPSTGGAGTHRPAQRPEIETFVAALVREIELRARLGGDRQPLATIHLGGGTPSTLTRGELGRVLAAVHEHFAVEPDAEIAIEANPEDLTAEHAAALVETGVNRVTLGIQSLDDAALRVLGRKHRREQALAALGAAREGGVRNLGVDLIFGVPGQTRASWNETLDRALDAAPEHLSCYELTIEAGTELDRARRLGKIEPCEADLLHQLFVATHDRLTAAGYEHYEVSNYARERRFRSRHNLAYWRHQPYVGVGPSAHSFDGRTRSWNHRDLGAWLADVEAARLPIAGSEALSPLELRREEILLGLRCVDGFAIEIRGRGAIPALPEPALAAALASGQLVRDADRVRPTFAGLTIADELARQLCP